MGTRSGAPPQTRQLAGALRVTTSTILPFALLVSASLQAQSQMYGVGRAPTAEEIRAWDISIAPTGEELPPGRGTVREGAQLYRAKGCIGCHGPSANDGNAPILKSKAGPKVELWASAGPAVQSSAPTASAIRLWILMPCSSSEPSRVGRAGWPSSRRASRGGKV